MPNQEAKTVAEAPVEKRITRFVCPVNLPNKGTNFMSELFRELCRILGKQRTSTTSFHPEGKAMIERTDRTLGESKLDRKPTTTTAHSGPRTEKDCKILSFSNEKRRKKVHIFLQRTLHNC